jgi:deoxycytidylate deaminase
MRITATDRRLFASAALKAVGSTANVRVGALLAKGRTTLAVTCNTATVGVKTPWLHAERQVLRDHERRRGCTLYVARLAKSGNIAPGSHPCIDCLAHILDGSTVSRLVWVDDEGNLRKRRV